MNSFLIKLGIGKKKYKNVPQEECIINQIEREDETQSNQIEEINLSYEDYQDASFLKELANTGISNGICNVCRRNVYKSWKKSTNGDKIFHRYCYSKKFKKKKFNILNH